MQETDLPRRHSERSEESRSEANVLSANTSWTYLYDDFNRLKQATNTSTTPNQVYQYLYDRFGNHSQQNYVQGNGTPYQIQLTFNANNQINGIIPSPPAGNPFRYDAAGNLMMDVLNCYTYDAENRLTSVAPQTGSGSGVCGATTMSYLYDPDGRRVARLQNGSIVKQYYYDAAGNMITEADPQGNTLRAEIYAGSRHLATWTNNATYFNHADWLGTERARTDSSGNRCETITSLPFGDGLVTSGACSTPEPTPNHFTGKERDSESGLDNFGKRYFGSALGRFQTPDPVLVSWRRMVNPQVWNAYSYVGNNPLRFVDPTGEELIQLGQHTDDEIKKRTREINQQLKDKDLTKDQKDALKRERNTLSLEKQGNHVVGNLLSKLDQTGQRNGLQLSNFTLSTDTRNDFAGAATPEAMQRLLHDQAFVIQDNKQFSGTIYIRTEPDTGFYQLSQRYSDFGYYGASALSHEQVHLNGGGEYPAFQRQRDVFDGFQNFFQNPALYHDLDQSILEGIDANKP